MGWKGVLDEDESLEEGELEDDDDDFLPVRVPQIDMTEN